MKLKVTGRKTATIKQEYWKIARKNAGGAAKHKCQVGRFAPDKFSRSSAGAKLPRIESHRTVCRQARKKVDKGKGSPSPGDTSSLAGAAARNDGSHGGSVCEARPSQVSSSTSKNDVSYMAPKTRVHGKPR